MKMIQYTIKSDFFTKLVFRKSFVDLSQIFWDLEGKKA